MTAYRPPRFSGLGAHVSGVSAWVIAKILERAMDSIQNLPAEERFEVLQTYDSLRAAGIYWNDQQRAFPRPTTAAEPQTEEVPKPTVKELSAVEAAKMVGLGDRRMRQLLTEGKIAGRRVASRWLVDAESLEDYVLARDVA